MYGVNAKSLETEVRAYQGVLSEVKELVGTWMGVNNDDRAIAQRLYIDKRLQRFLPQEQKDDRLLLFGQVGQKMLPYRPPKIEVGGNVTWFSVGPSNIHEQNALPSKAVEIGFEGRKY